MCFFWSLFQILRSFCNRSPPTNLNPSIRCGIDVPDGALLYDKLSLICVCLQWVLASMTRSSPQVHTKLFVFYLRSHFASMMALLIFLASAASTWCVFFGHFFKFWEAFATDHHQPIWTHPFVVGLMFQMAPSSMTSCFWCGETSMIRWTSWQWRC